MDEQLDRCLQCEHYEEDQLEYNYCHVCVMDHDCYKQKDDKK